MATGALDTDNPEGCFLGVLESLTSLAATLTDSAGLLI